MYVVVVGLDTLGQNLNIYSEQMKDFKNMS